MKFLIDENGFPIQGVLQVVSTEFVDGTSSSKQSAAIDSEIVRIATLDANVNLAFGANPTAVVDTDLVLPKNRVEIFKITRGTKIAVLGGKASITILQ